MKKTLVSKLGLLGVLSFLSYAAAVFVSPLAYPGYNPLAQAVSDLSAADAPSLALWNRLSAGYNVCEVVCATVVCIGMQNRKTKLLRTGVRALRAHAVDFCNRLPDVPAFHQRLRRHVSGCDAHGDYRRGRAAVDCFASGVVILAGVKARDCRAYGICAGIALAMMLTGAVGMKACAGVVFWRCGRCSVFAATGFNAALGILLFAGAAKRGLRRNREGEARWNRRRNGSGFYARGAGQRQGFRCSGRRS